MVWTYFKKNLEAYGIGAVAGIMLFLIINVALGRDLLPSPRRAHEPIAGPVVEDDPEKLYQNNCGACHQANGQGMPGAFPPLAGASWVTEDPETPVRVMLLGIQGPIEVNGETYTGVMPSQAHLSDEQLAKIATYIRTSFGNGASEVDPALVATLRAELSGRTDAIGGGAELETLRSR